MTSAVPSSRSHTSGRRALLGVLSGALVASGIAVGVAATSAPASAEPGVFKNVITIEPGTGFNAVSLYGDAGTVTASQPLANPKGPDRSCNLTDDGSGTSGILTLSARYKDSSGTVQTGNNVGLNGGSLGVAEKKSGTSCGQVEVLNAESMTLALTNQSAVAVAANFDIEVQKDVVVEAVTSLNGFATNETFVFSSGKNWNGSTSTYQDGCQGSATSSGANSNITDNCRWEIRGKKFDTIVLTAKNSGQFSLEGGADGLLTDAPAAGSGYPQRASFIELQDTLFCGESTFTLPLSGTAPQVTVRRLNNADPNQACTGFTYELTNTNAEVNFIKPFDTQTSVQFVMELVWPITYTQADLPPVKFSFHDKNGNLSKDSSGNVITHVLDWCASPIIKQGAIAGLTATEYAAAKTNPDFDMETGSGFPDPQFACVGPTTLQYKNDAPSSWVQPIYILGDAFARR